MAFIAIAGGVIAGGAAIGSAVIQNGAQNDAINAQKNALDSLQSLDIPGLENLASAQDLAKYKADFSAQVENDPAYAALRNNGAQGLLSLVNQDQSGTSTADTALKGLSSNINANSGANQSLISGLLSQASAELNAGATLPPEFQAELVRSGLENSGNSGLSIDGRGAAGTNIRTLLGSAGLQLQQQRQNQAINLGTTADNLQAQQQNALAELAQMSNSLSQAKAARAQTAVNAGNSTVPSIGLSGQDAANMSIANTNLANNKILGIGNLNAQKSLADGQMWSSILGSGTSMLTGALGGMGGMFGGAGGGITSGQAAAFNAGAGPVSKAGATNWNSYSTGSNGIGGILSGNLW